MSNEQWGARHGPRTENQVLRDENDYLRHELLRIEHETAQAAIARREELRVEEEKKANAERTARETAALEEHRRRAWFNAGLEQALARGNDAFVAFLGKSPEQHMRNAPAGWPVGVDPAQFRTVPATETPEPDATIANTTALGRALAAKGVAL